MGDVVNLRRARKAKARADRTERATANRAASGRTKAERETTAKKLERTARELEAHRRESRLDRHERELGQGPEDG